MCSVPPLGAFIKDTTKYVYPAVANKSEKYVCPDCNKDLILRKGQIRVNHFAHYKSDSPCNYYDKPSESQIHKDAKLLLKNLLESKKALKLLRKCKGTCGNEPEEYEIPIFSDTSQIIIEYRFNYNGLKIADVAYIDNDEIVCVFEIYNKHKTDNAARPEPWFEIDALKFINSINNEDNFTINCVRENTCDDCVEVICLRCNKLQPRWILNLNPIDNRICKTQSCYAEYRNLIYLEVPYADKDKVKACGGRFDGVYKKWYIHPSNNHKEKLLKLYKTVTPQPTPYPNRARRIHGKSG
jgi:hypothetical protein